MTRKLLSSCFCVLFALAFPAAPGVSAEADSAGDALRLILPAAWSFTPRAGLEVTLTTTDTGEELTVSGSVDEVFALGLGWIPVEPDTAYEVRYGVEVRALAGAADLSVLIREHAAEGLRPLRHHREPVRSRAIDTGLAGPGLERRFGFTTGPETQMLSGSLLIGSLEGTLRLGTVALVHRARQEAAERARVEAEYAVLMAEIRAKASAREPVVPRTLVFSRAQMKYGLERNYYHHWPDRPLFSNRAYRVPRRYMLSHSVYRRMLEIVTDYDIDGLAFFPQTRGRMGIFELHDEVAPPGAGLLPELVPGFTDDYVDVMASVLQRALRSPHAPRIDGKLLVTSYGAQSLTPEEWDAVLSELRERVGDVFLFLPSLTTGVSLRGPFRQGEPISLEMVEDVRSRLRAYLDVCDGIYFNYPAAFRNPDRTFDAAFYREMFIPVFASVLAEPAYRGKLLGLSAYKSHMNPDRGNSLHEDFTRTLRASFEAAMDARPDVILLPEWDEFNEHTCFRPTVNGSTSTMRILRYYMSRIRGIPPTPVPGDDPALPNLVISVRKVLTLGEVYTVELLHVPDTEEAEAYEAQLIVRDEQGRLLRAFDPTAFRANELGEARFSLPTEEFPGVRTLVPSLSIRGYRGRDFELDAGFHPTQVRATWNWDYLTVRQPLRALLRPVRAEVELEPAAVPGGPLWFSADIEAPEDLVLVEVLGDDDEVYAHDPDDGLRRADPAWERVLVEYRAVNTQPFAGTVALRHATGEWHTSGAVLHQPEPVEEIEGERVRFRSHASQHERWFHLAFPGEHLPEAVLELESDQASFEVPLHEVFERGMMAWAFENGLHITVTPYRRQRDLPPPLDARTARFRVPVWPEIETEQFHLRLTSADGRTWRSRPLLVPGADETPVRTLRIYSDAAKGGRDLTVDAMRVPDLVYDFEPARGGVLWTPAGRAFWATLGGFASAATGRGAYTGFFPGRLPNPVGTTAPAWGEADGRPVLFFDGIATYLKLPREALPRRGAFTLEFEIRPDVVEHDPHLFVTRDMNRVKGLALQIRNGRLLATFRDETWATSRFETGLAVPAGTWSHIRVRYDFETLRLSVGDAEESFTLRRPASNIGFTTFGDPWQGRAFHGALRSLRILHNAE